jgi:hypothetical protein
VAPADRRTSGSELGTEVGRGGLEPPASAVSRPGCRLSNADTPAGIAARELWLEAALGEGILMALPHRYRERPSVVLVEDVSQFACEGFGLTGVSELPAHEAAVMAGEHRRLLTK